MEPVGEETMRPSARNAETNEPSTVTSSSMMREGPALVMTTSFSTSPVDVGVAAASRHRVEQAALLVRVASCEHALERRDRARAA